MLTETTIFRGALWSAIGAIFERVMFFILPIFIAPLGPASLGIYYISLRTFYSVVSLLKVRRTNRLLIQHIQDPKSLMFEETAAFLLKAHFIAGLLVGIFFFILILTISPIKSLAFLALAIPFAFVNSYIILLLRLLQRFKQIFIIQVVFIFLFQLIYITIFIKILHMGIGTAFAGQFFMTVIISFISFIFIFDRLNLLGFFQKINIKMFIPSLLSFANLIYKTFSPILDVLVVLLLFGFSALGQYVVLLYLPLFIHRIPTIFFEMFIHVARVKTRASEDITQISKRVFKWVLIFTVPLFIAVMLFPADILSAIFHKTYVKNLEIAQLLAISFFVQSLGWVSERILVAKNKKVQRVISNYIFASMFIILALIFAHFASTFFASLASIALAFLISSILDSLVKYALVVKITKVFFIDMQHLKILFSGALGGLVSYIFFLKNPMLFFFFFFILYSTIIWIAGIINHQALLDFKKMVVKEVIGEPEYD